MFELISAKVKAFKSEYVVLGGDWNSTMNSRPVRASIDNYNTVGIPSECRTAWRQHLCVNLELTDPFRHFCPEEQEFTYVLFAEASVNRSRLDFS